MATTITVKEATLERFNRLKQEAANEEFGGGPSYSSNAFMSILMDAWEEGDPLERHDDVDLTPVMNRIDDLETELTRQHEDMTGGR